MSDPIVAAADTPERDLLDAIKGALLGTFTGDALGMPFEGTMPESSPTPLQMHEARMGAGTYTDDTEMTIAVAEALAEGDAVDADDLARRFLSAHDPRRGYGPGTLLVFELWRDGVSVEDAARQLFGGEGSMGNGAAMRVAPVGVRFARDRDRIQSEARRSALVTHAHPVGVDGAVVQASAVGAAIRREPILDAAAEAAGTEEMRSRLTLVERLLSEDAPPAPREIADRLGNAATAHLSVPAAVYAACDATTFEEAVTLAVRIGGDTDTIAAMAGAISGAWHGASAIPPRWLDVLEDGERGRGHVTRLAERLRDRMLG